MAVRYFVEQHTIHFLYCYTKLALFDSFHIIVDRHFHKVMVPSVQTIEEQQSCYFHHRMALAIEAVLGPRHSRQKLPGQIDRNLFQTF